MYIKMVYTVIRSREDKLNDEAAPARLKAGRRMGVMKSEWRVTSNTINGSRMFIAYRLRDTNGVDHSGNREYIENSGKPYYRGGYTENRALVEKLVTELNQEV